MNGCKIHGAEDFKGAGICGVVQTRRMAEGAMVAALGLDLHLLANAVSFGLGRVAAALGVAALAYILAAVAISILRSTDGEEARIDRLGLVLVTTLAVYLLSSWHLDFMWFGIVSVAALGLAALGIVIAEACAVASRFKPRH